MHYLLFYDVVSDYAERRGAWRAAHLQKVQTAHEAGDLVLAGALVEPIDGAVLVFRSAEAAEAFARTDPYVINGLVPQWRVRKWFTVVGDGAVMPQI